jgi:hypothetical protein
MERLGLAVLALLLLLAPAAAQEGSGVPSRVIEAEETRLLRILALGDGIGGGLGAGLLRLAEGSGEYEVTIRYNEESGLARPEVFDWATSVAKILEGNSYDIVVAMIGVNDRQMIRDGNVRYAFNSPEWIEAYAKQMDRVLDVLRASGARVYWVSLPPMANADYDAAMRTVAALQKERAEAKGASFVDIRKAFLKPDGSYSDSGPDDTGEVRKLRGKDGVSFFKYGNNRMAQLVLQAIAGSTLVTIVAEEEQAPPADSAPARRQRPRREVPLFGQNDLLGEALTVRPEDVAATAGLVVSASFGSDPAAIYGALRGLAQPGSSAEELFAGGRSRPAPKGRADDFSAPPSEAN